MFQVPEAIDDPVTRTAALASLVCSLMSLSFGCVYIVRFGSMKSMYHASKWAEVRSISLIFSYCILSPAAGSTQNIYSHLMECLGYARHTSNMDGMVSLSQTKICDETLI